MLYEDPVDSFFFFLLFFFYDTRMLGLVRVMVTYVYYARTLVDTCECKK